MQKRSSRVDVAFLLFLGAAARTHAGRSYGRHRVQQRSSRVAVLFLFAVASLCRVRLPSSRIAVASCRLLGAAAAIFSKYFTIIRIGIGSAVLEGGWQSATAQSDRNCFVLAYGDIKGISGSDRKV